MKHTRMMKSTLLFSLLAVLAACQEKIAPELSNPASATGPTTPTPTTTESHSFRLNLEKPSTGALPEVLGFTLHKANSLGTIKCSVDDIVDTPEALDSTRDISCILDAEEFALNYNGFSVNAVADTNTCDFVKMEPYRYWRLPPGRTGRLDMSARRMAFFKCDDQLLVDVPGMAVPTTYGTAHATYNTVQEMCGAYFNIEGSSTPTYGSIDLSPSLGVIYGVTNPGEMCSFNYVDGTQQIKCDEGSIIVHTINVKGTDTNSDGLIDTLTTSAGNIAETQCGGSIRACMSGGGRGFITSEFSESDFLSGIVGTVTQLSNNGGGTVNMEITSKFPEENNYYYSNFMRQCSGVTNFNSRSSFSGAGLTSYDPSVMKTFVSTGINNILLQEKDDATGLLDVVKLADHPFSAGYSSTYLSTLPIGDKRKSYSNTRLKAQPYYVFECLDKAKDVRARINLVVREWNREFDPATENLQIVSDAYKSLVGTYVNRPKMDAGSPVGLAEFLSQSSIVDSSFNDYSSWDDMIIFDNTSNANTATCNQATTTDTGYAPLKSIYWFPGVYE